MWQNGDGFQSETVISRPICPLEENWGNFLAKKNPTFNSCNQMNSHVCNENFFLLLLWHVFVTCLSTKMGPSHRVLSVTSGTRLHGSSWTWKTQAEPCPNFVQCNWVQVGFHSVAMGLGPAIYYSKYLSGLLTTLITWCVIIIAREKMCSLKWDGEFESGKARKNNIWCDDILFLISDHVFS